MKRQRVLTMFAVLFTALYANSQYYVSSSTSNRKDIFGNTTTTHQDRYGNTIGTATISQTDIFGNTTTTFKDIYAIQQASQPQVV